MPRPQNLASDPALRRALLDWFHSQGRLLPWRKTRDPYPIWVSEIMLQQTQVATVIPYYEGFLRRFPSVTALARAPLERVLESWSGLGYYRRARNLHAAARVVVERFGGRFPARYEEARTLPGVGDYTARAVLSIAYNQPLAVLDGNVARVIARLRAFRGSLHQSGFRRAVEQDLNRLLSRRRPGDFNQAVMELGQTVCLPRAPQCPQCPLRRACAANLEGKVWRYPTLHPRRKTELRYLGAAVFRRGQRVALLRGLDEGLLTDLWNFPSAFGRSQQQAREALYQKLAALVPGKIQLGPPVGELRHGITHRSIRIRIYPAHVRNLPANDSIRWLPLSRFQGAAVSQVAKKIAACLTNCPK